MGFIQQTGSALPDCTQFTASIWVRHNLSPIFSTFTIFEFGNNSGFNSFIAAGHDSITSGQPGYYVRVMLTGENYPNPGTDVGHWSPVTFNAGYTTYTAPTPPLGFVYNGFGNVNSANSYNAVLIPASSFSAGDHITFNNHTSTGTSYVWQVNLAFGASPETKFLEGRTNYPGTQPLTGPSDSSNEPPFNGPQLTPGVWHHIFVACDTLGGTIVDETPTTVDNFGVFTKPPDIFCPFYIYIDGVSAINYNNLGGIQAPNSHPASGTIPGQFVLDGANINPRDREGLLVQGYDIALPGIYPQASQFNSTESTSVIKEYAACQIWTSQFIDPTNSDNLAKFIRASDGKLIAPVIYSKSGVIKGYGPAVKAFGMPDLLFDGNHTQFPMNRGTGGSFASNGGTITDFTPYPSGKG